jgi:hypothetical protein
MGDVGRAQATSPSSAGFEFPSALQPSVEKVPVKRYALSKATF